MGSIAGTAFSFENVCEYLGLDPAYVKVPFHCPKSKSFFTKLVNLRIVVTPHRHEWSKYQPVADGTEIAESKSGVRLLTVVARELSRSSTNYQGNNLMMTLAGALSSLHVVPPLLLLTR